MFPDLGVRDFAALVCHAETVREATARYRLCAPFIANYKFIFAVDEGGWPGHALNRTFAAGAAVRSLFATEKVFVLDSETFMDMETGGGKVTYPSDYSISLDTMAMSYLEPYIAGRSSAKLPKDIQEVFEFIARDDVNVDPIPYLSENRFNLGDTKAADRIFAKLRAYEVLRTLDKGWLSCKGEARSTLTPSELDSRALNLISGMYESLHNHALMDGLRRRHRYMYVCLMKMVLLHLRGSGRKVLDKMTDFLIFCDEELGAIFAREAAIARAYFERGQKLTFFGKIQAGREDLLSSLKNMAWDLWHIRQLEEGLTLAVRPEARYFFTALLTFDKRLIEIMDLYSLRSFAFSEDGDDQIPVYDGDWFDAIAADESVRDGLLERFYSDGARRARAGRTEVAKANLVELEARLERELSQL